MPADLNDNEGTYMSYTELTVWRADHHGQRRPRHRQFRRRIRRNEGKFSQAMENYLTIPTGTNAPTRKYCRCDTVIENRAHVRK